MWLSYYDVVSTTRNISLAKDGILNTDECRVVATTYIKVISW